jgi:hypothetical protein
MGVFAYKHLLLSSRRGSLLKKPLDYFRTKTFLRNRKFFTRVIFISNVPKLVVTFETF